MNRKLILALVLLLGMGPVRAQIAYSVKWLKSGCVGFSKFTEDSEDLTEKEAKDAQQLGVWLQGYLQAVEMLSYSSDGRIEMVPDEWSNSIPASKSLLSYLNEFERQHRLRIPDTFEAKSFVNLWYKVKHPKTKPAMASAYEQLFLQIHFPDAFDAQDRITENKVAPDVPRILEIEINGRKIGIPVPAGLVRIDGRLKSLDDAVAQMAAPMNNRVHVLFASPEDSALIDHGKLPTLSRTVSVQHNKGLPKTTSRKDFVRITKDFTLGLPAMDKTLSKHFEKIEDAASRAMTEVTALKSTMKFGETKSLGIFDSGEDFLCHSVLLHMDASVAGEKLSMIQATSVAAIRTNEQVVSIYVNALYESPEDLKWTREICKTAVAAMTGNKTTRKDEAPKPARQGR